MEKRAAKIRKAVVEDCEKVFGVQANILELSGATSNAKYVLQLGIKHLSKGESAFILKSD